MSDPIIRQIDPTALVDSPWEPPARAERDIEALAASMRQHGVIEPLIVRGLARCKRCHGSGNITCEFCADSTHDHACEGGTCEACEGLGYETVEIGCGHRRRRAAVLAGLPTVPCIVRELTDEQAQDLMLVENVQRESLTPLEEATSMTVMLDRGWCSEDIAERIGRSPSFVARRLSLLRLDGQARGALGEGKITLVIAEALATLMSREDAAAALLRLLAEDSMPRRRALAIIDEYRRLLVRAPWSLIDTELGAAACSTCPQRSSAQALLFEDGADLNDRCLNAGCWENKKRAHEQRLMSGRKPPKERDAPEIREPKGESTAKPPKPTVEEVQSAAEKLWQAEALAAVVATAAKVASVAAAELRHLVALLVAGCSTAPLDVARRLGLEADDCTGRDALLKHVAEQTDVSRLWPIVIELALRCDSDYPPTRAAVFASETSLHLAARFAGVNLIGLVEAAEKRVRKETKRPAKEALPKAAKSPASKELEPPPQKPARSEEPKAKKPRKPARAAPSAEGTKVVAEPPPKGAIEAESAERMPWIDQEVLKALASAPRLTVKELRNRIAAEEEVDEATVFIACSRLRDAGKIHGTTEGRQQKKTYWSTVPTLELSVSCKICKAKEGQPCKRDGGGFHAPRTKLAQERRDGTGRPDPLRVACGECEAQIGHPCVLNGNATRPHESRVEAAKPISRKEAPPSDEEKPRRARPRA